MQPKDTKYVNDYLQMFEVYERFPKNLKDMLTLRQYVYSSTELIFYHYVNLLLLLIILASTLLATLHLRNETPYLIM